MAYVGYYYIVLPWGRGLKGMGEEEGEVGDVIEAKEEVADVGLLGRWGR